MTDVASLGRSIGVTIDGELLQQALTHRSFAYEHGQIPHNERLEFLGDSILGQAVTVMLYRENPRLDEGELAKRRASLVSSAALAEIARGIGLGEHLRLGRGEVLTGGRDKSSILADTVEAVIGAAYLSVGPDEATALVLRLIAPLLNDPERFGASMDPKTALQELSAHLGRGAPRYAVTETGPDHSKRFLASVALADGRPIATGEGTSKKYAEMAAALTAWTLLQGPDAPEPEPEPEPAPEPEPEPASTPTPEPEPSATGPETAVSPGTHDLSGIGAGTPDSDAESAPADGGLGLASGSVPASAD